MSFSIGRSIPRSYITKELGLKVIEQFKDLVNWLKDSKANQEQKEQILYLMKEKGETWRTPCVETLEPLPKFMKWGFFGKERAENKEVSPKIWSKALESIIHGLLLSTDCEMQVVDGWGIQPCWKSHID